MNIENIKIEDNFLKQEDFDKIQEVIEKSTFFPWFLHDEIDSKDDVDKFQFIHLLWHRHQPSDAIQHIEPIITKLDPVSLFRIKANLLTRTHDIVVNTFHVDIGSLSEEKLRQWTTSIFYVNTNNGYTKFEDGTKVESVANRMLSFPANIKHTGTSCTDEKTRIIINFNYFK